MKVRLTTLGCCFGMMLVCLTSQAATKRISMTDLHEKIAGAWIGQMVGNIYGLAYENKFVDQPGPETWPYDFSKSINKMKVVNGAFSDDDTDFEYLYLLMMEKYGIEPTYEQIKEGWMYHVRDRVWLANRAALGLMYHGYTPPFTGKKELNPHWFQIDPQLINEIWGYTAPGMVKYAADKSAWGARVTSDSWAVSPTVHYGAMYANAFFEDNIRTLIEEALAFLPKGDRYANTVREMLDLYDLYPNDWKKSRQLMAKHYYQEEPEMTRTIWNANLNGACGILALLYGEGDFEKTLNIGCAMGFDCDNQTATISGILGIIKGGSSIPASLSMPFEGWKKPFNDRYINVTRYDMPDASIEDMIQRTVDQAVKIVCAKGGRIIEKKGVQFLQINTDAIFQTPMEFCLGPMPRMEIGKGVDYSFACVSNEQYKWSLKSGSLPDGLLFNQGKLSGTPLKAGKYPIVLEISDGDKSLEQPVELLVRSKNIAPEADTLFSNVREINMTVLDSCWITFSKPMYANSVDVLIDGKLRGEGSVFYSLADKTNKPKVDYFGVGWNKKKTINGLAFHYGCLEEFGGWLTSVSIQYLNDDNKWTNVDHVTCSPELPKSDVVFFQPHFVEFVFEFPAVETTGIRLIGDTKVQEHWHKYTKQVSSFTSVTELSVYEQ